MKKLVKSLSILTGLLLLVVTFTGCSCMKKGVQTEEVKPVAAMEETQPAPAVTDEELEALKKAAQAEGALLPIYFDFDKSSLQSEAKANLDKTAVWLSKNATVTIRIEGNCDERGTNEYNMALGERRANSAKEYLAKLGIAADRLATVSWGEEKPLDPGHNEAAWAKNRRDDFNPTSK